MVAAKPQEELDWIDLGVQLPGADEKKHAQQRVAEERAERLSHVLEGPQGHAVDQHHHAELGRVEVGHPVRSNPQRGK